MRDERPDIGVKQQVMHRLASLDGAVAGGAAALLIFLVTLCAMAPLTVMPVNFYGPDLAHYLLATKLIREGWTLHDDIITPLGELAFRPFVWGAALGETSASALVFARLVDGAAIVLLTPLVCWRRLSAMSAALVGAAMTATALMPMNLGEEPWLLSSAMEYNKVGFALTGLAFCLLIPMAHGRKDGVYDIAIAGILITLCFHLKVTFAFAIVGGIAVGAFVLKFKKLATLSISILIANMIVSISYIENILNGGFRSYEGNISIGYLVYSAVSNIEPIAIFVIAAVLCWIYVRNELGREIFVAGLVLACGFALLTQNAQRLLIPSTVVAVVLLYEACRRTRSHTHGRSALIMFLAAISVLYPAIIVGDWFLGAWHYNSAQRARSSSYLIEAGAFSGILVRYDSSTDKSEVARDCRDAQSLTNFLLQEEEIRHIFESKRVDIPHGETVFVDEVDLPVLFGHVPWPGKSLLWRVSASGISPSDGAELILIPRFSKMRDDYIATHVQQLETEDYLAGVVGCMEFLSRKPDS